MINEAALQRFKLFSIDKLDNLHKEISNLEDIIGVESVKKLYLASLKKLTTESREIAFPSFYDFNEMYGEDLDIFVQMVNEDLKNEKAKTLTDTEIADKFGHYRYGIILDPYSRFIRYYLLNLEENCIKELTTDIAVKFLNAFKRPDEEDLNNAFICKFKLRNKKSKIQNIINNPPAEIANDLPARMKRMKEKFY